MRIYVGTLLGVLLFGISGCSNEPELRVKFTPAPAPTDVYREADEAPANEPDPIVVHCTLTGSRPGQVEVTDDGAYLTATWTGLPVAPTDTTGYYVTVSDAAGDSAQLGVKFLDGEQIGFFIADLGGSQENIDDEPAVDGDTVAAVFPKDVGFLAGTDIARWSAAYTVAGNDVGNCPSQSFPG
jgi:hypothetical protein